MRYLSIIISIIIGLCGITGTSCSQKQKKGLCDTDTTNVTENIDPDGFHFQFLGIPIHGTPDAFGKALESKGFHLQDSYTNGHHGEYWGKFFNSYAYVKIGYEERNNMVYEVEATFKNYSKSQRQDLLERLIEKYSEIDAHIIEDTDGDYEIIIWTPEGKNSHPEFDKKEISPLEIKGVIVFENNSDDLILRYIDALNKNLHFWKEDEDL